ncbi:CopG family transcriptional regulator [Streptomyces polyrhachis]|uniref:CopG family transcriptional regulator n=1 Tax=Streptomyces polyrhachis TaxID=1282885 RepID=A0ABW2GBZ7_9ACTN
MKRTNVYADPEDLAIIKEAAKRRGISEAETIRQGSHPAAMANRVWDEPLFPRTFEGAGRTPGKSEVRDTAAHAVRRETGAGFDTDAVLTLNRRDFRAVRPLGRHKAFRVLPEVFPL